MRVNYRYRGKWRRLVGRYNEMVSTFVGFCKQRGIMIFISASVRDEAQSSLVKAVNEKMDKLRVDAFPVRYWIIQKCLKRLRNLLETSVVKEVDNPPIERVKNMYASKKEKLLKIKRFKKRSSLYPSKIDQKILSEAAKLAEQYVVYFITVDLDFTEFREEIENEFGVRVVHPSELVSLSQKL